MSGQKGSDATVEGGSEVTGDNIEFREGGGLAMGLTSLILYFLPHHTQ